ncbi:MAG: TIR domain-containing protein [Solirubrobacterales bacterium]
MLVLARHIAEELLATQIEQGHALIERASLVGDLSDYESWKGNRRQWVTVTAESVASIFASSAEAQEFTQAASSPADGKQWQVEYANDLDCVRSAVDVLISLQHRIESAPQPAAGPPPLPELGLDSAQRPAEGVELEPRVANGSVSSMPSASPAGPAAGKRERQIFLIHGRDEKRMQAAVQLLETAGSHEITVMHDGPNEGRTLVERFAGAAQSAYAIVLLTADDVGTPRLDLDEEPYFSPRARQGVVFQLGFLVGALTPSRVCVLYEHGVELPSNLDGLAYVRFDLAGAWQSKLLVELRGAGFDYDPAKLVVQPR